MTYRFDMYTLFVVGSTNDINVLNQYDVFNKVLQE